MAKKRFSIWKWLVILLPILAVAAILYFNRDDDSEIQYMTGTITRGDLTQVVTATGTLNPVVNVEVGSQISGIIQALHADFNSPVKSNQVIARLDPSTYQANVHSAEGDLSNARAALELGQVEARRAEELLKDSLISQSQYDTTLATLHQNEAMVKIKEAALENAKVSLARCTIYSPVDGTVISRNVDIGQTVAASLSAPVLFRIANDLTKMQINAAVSEADIGTVEEGQSVTFTVYAFAERRFNGVVKQIRNSPTNVQNVVTYDTVIEVSNPDLKLRPGMTADASIVVAHRSDVLRIPTTALRFRPPEPSTNQSAFSRFLSKIGLGEDEPKPAATNAAPSPAGSTDTNRAAQVAGAEPPLTGNEPPEELARRVREMRDRGEEIPPNIRDRMREHYQTGALQRRGGGGGGGRGGGGEGFGGPGGGGSASAMRPRVSQPAFRTVHVLAPDPSGKGDPAPQPIRIRTGISDGAYTEVLEGLKEGDVVITSVRFPQAQTAAPSGGASPFGGGGGRRGR